MSTMVFVFGVDDPLGADDRVAFALSTFNKAHVTSTGYGKASVVVSTLLGSPDDLEGVPVYMVPSSDFLPDMLVVSNDGEIAQVVNLSSEYGQSRGLPPQGAVPSLQDMLNAVFMRSEFGHDDPPDADEDQAPDPASTGDGTIPQNGTDAPGV